MGRISTCFLLMGLTSVLVLLSPANCIPFSVEDRLHQLTEDFVHMKEVLAAKDARLQQVTDDLHLLTENFEEKNVRLELKVNRLEEIVQQQETQIAALQQKEKPLNEFIPSHLASNDQRPMGKSVSFPRTCRELRAADPTLSSGLHFIDPDGQGVGDDPIQVYCDMLRGSTLIVHDTESAMDVGHCADPGCYSRPVKYNATTRQINALFELSSECHQSIQYDCNYAPFEIGGITYAWWNDVNGVARYFWSGSDGSAHICQCGIENNCVEPSMPCNCDSTVPVPLTDKGVISDKSFLPITRLNFGRTQLASSSGIHTLGRLECTGQVTITGMPKSCADLWRIGHSLSGLHSVMGAEQVETVYCDFEKLPSDSGFQKRIGFNDIKSQPVYFYVQRNTTFNKTGTPIPFELEVLNIGNAMDLASGIFTAPRAGIYHFAFDGNTHFPQTSSRINFVVQCYLNGASIEYGNASDGSVSSDQDDESFSLQSTLNLKKGDQIWLQITTMSTGTFLHIEGTYFSGWLLEEKISESLNAM